MTEAKRKNNLIGPEIPFVKKTKIDLTTPNNSYNFNNIPTTNQYELSYMHRTTVTHVGISITNYLITGSADGIIKFWKKEEQKIEFVKEFKAHTGKIIGFNISHDGVYFASTSFSDNSIKIFDIINFDMINIIELKYKPNQCVWIHPRGNSINGMLACSEIDSYNIHIFSSEKSNEVSNLKLHSKPVILFANNCVKLITISVDNSGIIEYWQSNPPHSFPTNITFQYKIETDLYFFAKNKIIPTSINVSYNGKLFVTLSTDQTIRIWDFNHGKIIKSFDESLKLYESIQIKSNPLDARNPKSLTLESFDFGQRKARENERLKKLENSLINLSPNVIFDETSTLIVYSSLIGIKFRDIKSGKCIMLIGKQENSERFLKVTMSFQNYVTIGKSSVASFDREYLISGNKENDRNKNHPMLFCNSFKKNRFYIFSKKEPKEDLKNAGVTRDIINEKPLKSIPSKVIIKSSKRMHASGAIIRTTIGDIHVKLYWEKCPRTVENFVGLCKKKYYDGVIFHRIIKKFMVQTGDPLGTGVGGESFWGGVFEDEFQDSLKHDRPGIMSMANKGPNTNGSQFFFTLRECSWLDGKNTVFGNVEKGMDVLFEIEKVKTSKLNKPHKNISIMNVHILE